MKEREIIAKEWRDDNGILHRREVGQELIRCKECKYYAEHNELYINSPTNCVKHSTINHYVVVNADDFCSCGERRE